MFYARIYMYVIFENFIHNDKELQLQITIILYSFICLAKHFFCCI